MPQELPPQPSLPKLPIPQIRVLLALLGADGPLTRADLSELIGNKTNVVAGRAVGYSDPVKRLAFEQTKDGGGSPGKPFPSLLSAGYVREEVLVGDITETVIHLTKEGRSIAEQLQDIELPPLRD